MDVIEQNLLIIQSEIGKSKIIRVVNNNGTYIFPMFWILSNKLRGALLIDESLHLYAIRKIDMIGVPKPRRMEIPLFTYVLLLLFGCITFSIPVLVKFKFKDGQQMDLENVKQIIISHINNNLGGYQDNILNNIRSAKSFRSISSIFKYD
ncbi:MAG: hypothetical protein WAX77_02855 [Methylococcaceae bacterium]